MSQEQDAELACSLSGNSPPALHPAALLYDGEEVSAERVPKPAPDHDWHEVLSDPGCSASQVDGKAWDAHPFTDRSSPFEGMKSRDALRKRF